MSSDAQKVKLLGYGEYVGDVVPERPIGMMGQYESWEAIAKMMNEGHARPMDGSERWTVEHVQMKNPLIRLDSGVEVWGAECWWGSEAKVRGAVEEAVKNGAELVELDPRRVPGLLAYVEEDDK